MGRVSAPRPVASWSLPPSEASLPAQLEMDIEASDNTFRRREEAALRVSEHQNPFSLSRLQPFHRMSEHAVDATLALYRQRAARQKQFLEARHGGGGGGGGSGPHARQRQVLEVPDDRYKLIKEQADIRVYRHAQRRGKTTSMVAQGLLRGSLAEIMDGLYAESTKEARVLYPLLSPAFLDVSVLHVDSYRTAQHPFQFAGVTWMALETPRGYGVCKDRDFLCFEKMGTIKDPDGGDDVGFLTLLSVDQSEATTAHFLRAAAASASSASYAGVATGTPEFVRGFLSLTAFFKKLPNGLVSMFVQGDFNARGHLAGRLADHMFAELVFALGNAPKCGQAKSLAMLLQSISAGQLPPGGIVASASGSNMTHLLPLIAERNRDRCGVCCKTLWRVIESPEFCRSCWMRTCRNCHVTMPIYCADFHRAHDDDGSAAAAAAAGGAGRPSAGYGRKKKFKKLPKPCKETFCLKCVCSVLPNGIKMNAKLLKQTAKKKKRTKKFGAGSLVSDPTLLRRGVGRTALSTRQAPSVVMSTASRPSKPSGGNGGGGGGSAGGSSRGREPGKVYVQMPRAHHHALRSRGAPHFDDQSSISMLSSVESEKLQRQRLSLTKTSAPKPPSVASPPQHPSPAKPQPASMLEVLENFQLSQMTTTMSADLSEQLSEDRSFKSYSSCSGHGPIHPTDSSSSMLQTPNRKLQLLVNLTPRKRARRSSTTSSRIGSGSSQHSSKRTNAATSHNQSPPTSGPAFDEAYYNQALQRYLANRRTSLGLTTTSSTVSAEHFESLDKSSAEATALAVALGGGRVAVNSKKSSARDSHKMRVLRDLHPISLTGSYLDRPPTPSRLSLSSISSDTSSSGAARSSSAYDEHPSSKRARGGWAPAAY